MCDGTSVLRNCTCQLKYNEPMANHTSFRIGGSAEVMAFPKTAQELSELLKLGVPTRILGAGTNVLAPDEGIPGLVICLKDCLDGMELLAGNRIRVMAGVTMTRAAVFAANQGLSGLEFAHGIPGTVGGGVYMNAGAYGGEICQVCASVEVMKPDGSIVTLTNRDMAFSYRHSALEETGDIVLSATFALKPKAPEEIKAKMKELMAKRPVGGYAAALIDEAGLRGFAVGGAAISTKHAGFAVNLGGATAADVRSLLTQVSDIVYDRSGIRLELEVRIW